MTSTDGRHGSRADELLADWADLAGRARRPHEAPTRPKAGLGRMVVMLSAPVAFAMLLLMVIGSMLPRESVSRMGVGATAAPSDGCPVTVPNGAHPGAWPATPLDHGQDGIFTALAPEGTIRVSAGTMGGGDMLWRDALFAIEPPATGPLSVTGRRLDADPETMTPTASPSASFAAGSTAGIAAFQVETPDGVDGPGPIRVDLGFPVPGCWEIVATAGPSELRFVTRVEQIAAREAAACQVTRPNGAHTGAWPASELDHGEGGLFTVLWPGGTLLIPASEVDRDGVGWMKFVFQREGAAEGELRIGGRRIGAGPGDPRGVVTSQVPDGYGTTGIQATAIGFPAEGCWEVIATSGTAQLRFRTWVELGAASPGLPAQTPGGPETSAGS